MALAAEAASSAAKRAPMDWHFTAMAASPANPHVMPAHPALTLSRTSPSATSSRLSRRPTGSSCLAMARMPSAGTKWQWV